MIINQSLNIISIIKELMKDPLKNGIRMELCQSILILSMEKKVEVRKCGGQTGISEPTFLQ